MWEKLKKEAAAKAKAWQEKNQKKAEEKKRKKQNEKKAKAEKKEKERVDKEKKNKEKKEKREKENKERWEKIGEWFPFLSGKAGNNEGNKNPKSGDSKVKGKTTSGIPDSTDSMKKFLAASQENSGATAGDFIDGIKRGGSQVGRITKIFYNGVVDESLDRIELLLALRKGLFEKYPALAVPGDKARAFVASVGNELAEDADWFGNKVYEADIPVLSDFVGGLFNASSMEDNGSPAAAYGSFYNGIVRSLAGTAEGLTYIVTDPAGAIEMGTKIVRDPDIYGGLLWESAKDYTNKNLTNGSVEDRSRFAGEVFTEVLTTIFTLGAGNAAKVSKVGKAADAADTIGDAAKLSDTMLDGARGIGGLLDDIGDAGGDAGKWIENIDDVAPRKGVSIESVGKGGSGAGERVVDFETWLLRQGIDPERVPMDSALFQKIKAAYEKNGGLFLQDADAQALLDYRGADACTLGHDTVLFKSEPTISEVFEELIHTAQYRGGIIDGTAQSVVYAEIEAAEKLIRNRGAYRIPDTETLDTIRRAQNLINDYHNLGMDDSYLADLIDKISDYATEFGVTIH